jgi:hypothetical protein
LLEHRQIDAGVACRNRSRANSCNDLRQLQEDAHGLALVRAYREVPESGPLGHVEASASCRAAKFSDLGCTCPHELKRFTGLAKPRSASLSFGETGGVRNFVCSHLVEATNRYLYELR